jgi:glycerol-3-phosphate acyltransferase PlsY
LKFRGGKGVATGLGSFAAIAPKAVLVMLGVFIAVVLASRYVSLASIVAVALFPLIAWLLGSDLDKPLMIGVMATASLLIVAKHHGNIRRLLAGTESRFSLRRG